MSLWRSGIFWAVLAFAGSLGNFAFTALIAHHFNQAEYGLSDSVMKFTTFLALPQGMVTTAVIHYISHFRTHNDEARLQGLLIGCRKFLRNTTIAGTVLVAVAVVPVGSYFAFRKSLILAAAVCILIGLWSSFAIALCQGMAWFKRLAVIGFLAVCLRLVFGYFVALPINTAEMAVSATTFSLLANLALLYWWKDIFKSDAQPVSPWTPELFRFIIISSGYVGANWFFSQGDSLAAKRHFPETLGLYSGAANLGRAVFQSVGPFLQVLFTSRSGKRSQQSAADQRILLGLYAVGLASAAGGLVLFRSLAVRILFGKLAPEAAAMVTALIPRLAAIMVFAGLCQAIGAWCLASRWFKLTLLYGFCGLAYWIALLALGLNPDALLNAMLIGSAASFALLCALWLNTLRQNQTVPQP